MSNTTLRMSVRAAILAHDAWKEKLNNAIYKGEMPDKIADVSCDHKCTFGRWLYGDQIPAAIKQGKPYQVVKRLHAEFHACVGDILTCAVTGKGEEATRLYENDYAQRSDKLKRALNKWYGELERS